MTIILYVSFSKICRAFAALSPSPYFGHCVQVFEGFCTVRVLNEKVLSNFNLTASAT